MHYWNNNILIWWRRISTRWCSFRWNEPRLHSSDANITLMLIFPRHPLFPESNIYCFGAYVVSMKDWMVFSETHQTIRLYGGTVSRRNQILQRMNCFTSFSNHNPEQTLHSFSRTPILYIHEIITSLLYVQAGATTVQAIQSSHSRSVLIGTTF